MNKYLLVLPMLLFSIVNNAQVAIGKATVNGDGLLDFLDNTTNGILLPIVTTLPTGSAATNGTLLMDFSDKKIKMRSNNQWVELTKTSGDVSTVTINTSNDIGQGVIIGASTSSASGVLVLESTQKALILPKIYKPHLNVINPYPGMICYDTYNNCLSVFNGSHWYFWK
jgi:hypothetical protein